MDGQEIMRRLTEGRCIVCGSEIDDRKLGALDWDGFPYKECRDHRHQDNGRKPGKFNHKAEQKAGIANLEKLGA